MPVFSAVVTVIYKMYIQISVSFPILTAMATLSKLTVLSSWMSLTIGHFYMHCLIQFFS